MLQWLKKHFIPHEGNDHKPHFLRRQSATLLLGVLIVMECVYLFQGFVILPRSSYFAAVFASVLVDETNQNRTSDHLGTLTTNQLLVAAAQLKANDMAAKGYFSHNSPDGKTPWDFIDTAGYTYSAAGENLAVNFTESQDVTDAWMRSPLHRANIMNGNYTEIGIATAQGVYKGQPAVFVVQMFGKPKELTLTTLITPTTTPVQTVAHIATKTAQIASSTITPPTPIAHFATVTPLVHPILSALNMATSVAPTTLVAGTQTTNAEEGARKQLLSAQLQYTNTPSWFEKLIASPRAIANSIYGVIALLLFIVITSVAFVKLRTEAHSHLLVNGVLLMVFVGTLIFFNILLGHSFGSIF